MPRLLRQSRYVLIIVAAATASPLALAADEGPYEVIVERDVMVPMRDGVKLATDLYIPAKNGKRISEQVPAVLLRVPYNKAEWSPDVPRFFATHGYLSASQDCRGRFQSQGKFFPFVHEPNDGYDAIEWLARHPLCNGKVGMHGVSYMSWVQYEAATQTPPHLKAMIPHCGPINAYKYSPHIGGANLLSGLQWEVLMAMTSQEAAKNPAIAKKIEPMRHGQNFMNWAARMPWRRGATPIAAEPHYEDIVFKFFFENPNYNDFWRQPGLGMDEYLHQFPKIPILSVVGWYEIYPRSVCDSHEAFVRRKFPAQHLLCGPWTHNNQNASCGDANFGPAATKVPGIGSFQRYQVNWFNRWLKGDARAQIGAPVKIFVMGGGDGRRGEGGRINHGGSWYEGNAWPPIETKMTHFYCHAGGVLSPQKPVQRVASTSYDYDPRNSVSSVGRCEIDYGHASGGGFTGMGPRDQIQQETLPGHGEPGKPIAARKDVLVFQTPPLDRDTTIAGDIRTHLHISSDAPDTDFYINLIDVYPPSADYPNGYAFPLTDGILRARYHAGFEQPKLLESGKVYELTIPIQPVANLFKRGHRIRVDISSSSFPNFDINRNTGDPLDPSYRIAHNTIHHDAAHASSIELPVFQVESGSP